MTLETNKITPDDDRIPVAAVHARIAELERERKRLQGNLDRAEDRANEHWPNDTALLRAYEVEDEARRALKAFEVDYEEELKELQSLSDRLHPVTEGVLIHSAVFERTARTSMAPLFNLCFGEGVYYCFMPEAAAEAALT
jgi:hypothetical protein